MVTVACYLFPVQNIELTDDHKKLLNSWSLNTFIEYKVLFISIVAFLIGLSYSSVLGFLSIYADNLGLSTAGAFFFVVYALIITFTRPFAGQIFDAKQLLEKKELTKISISELVKRAGVSRAAFYRNYDSKEYILETVLRSVPSLTVRMSFPPILIEPC